MYDEDDEDDEDEEPAGYTCFIPVCSYRTQHTGPVGRQEYDAHMERHSAALAEGRRIAELARADSARNVPGEAREGRVPEAAKEEP